MKITVLAENTSINENIGIEHGLSLHIETNGKKILFDMGQTELFYYNANKLGIDIGDVDIAILSHAHYDHGGGIEKFFEVNKKAPLYLNKNADVKCYSTKYIGLNEKNLELNEKRLVFTDDLFKIEEGLFLCTKNEEAKNAKYPMQGEGLTVEKNGEKVPDDFLHEQYFVIDENGKRIVFSGCSHKGILNISKWFNADALFGGFHFSKIELNENGKAFLNNATSILKENNTLYYTCHCTGKEQYNYMKKIMGNRLEYASGGMQINI